MYLLSFKIVLFVHSLILRYTKINVRINITNLLDEGQRGSKVPTGADRGGSGRSRNAA